jgi:predicted glycoside hydrolase/deacetylase ChbG (UPF0249 family)
MKAQRYRRFSAWMLAGVIFTTTALPEDTPDSKPTPADSIELIIRMDDLGFCHGVNQALKRVLETGVCTSISVMVNSPWLLEAAEILKQHPEVSVGVHLVLNCEWREYRLGPVSPAGEVPTLVDSFGHFFGTRAELMANRPNLAEVEKELRAQLDRGLQVGLNISYCDYHMGTAISTQEFREIVEKLAKEYKLAMSGYFGEQNAPNVYTPPPDQKLDWGVGIIESLPPGRHLMLFHPGTDTPEMAAMTDLNAGGVKQMSKHRQAEADVLCSPEFQSALKKRGIKLLGYRELHETELSRMKRPNDSMPYADAVNWGIQEINKRAKQADKDKQPGVVKDPYSM